eukprot:1648829-Prymnesium_polylepis.1
MRSARAPRGPPVWRRPAPSGPPGRHERGVHIQRELASPRARPDGRARRRPGHRTRRRDRPNDSRPDRMPIR